MRHVWAVVVVCTGCLTEAGYKGDDTDAAADDTDSPAQLATEACVTDNEACEPGAPGCRGEGPQMLPGSDCLACHVRGGDREAPPWSAGGTAFVDADGTAPLEDAIVRVTDSNGDVVEMETNGVGNFYTMRTLVPPLQAEIEVDGAVRTMGSSVETGACGSCHSCDGAAGAKIYGP